MSTWVILKVLYFFIWVFLGGGGVVVVLGQLDFCPF